MNHPTGRAVPAYRPGLEHLYRMPGAAVCAGSAGIHAALVPEHLHQSGLLGVAFAVDSVLLALAAVLLTGRRASPSAPVAAAAVLAGTAAAYLLSRTAGVPGLVPGPEPLDGLGLSITLLELLAACACVLLAPRKEGR
jgi:hypothetical protein